jgi:hypothetical protein
MANLRRKTEAENGGVAADPMQLMQQMMQNQFANFGMQ